MTFDLKEEKRLMLESIQKAGGAALVDTYDLAPEQNLPGLDFVNPDDPKEKYDNLSAYHHTVLHDNDADMPFSSDLFQNEEVSDKLAGRQTAEDKDDEAERYIYKLVNNIMQSLDKGTNGRYFYDNPPPESIRDAFWLEKDDNLRDLLAQALRVGTTNYIKNGRAKWADFGVQPVPDPSDVKSQAQAEKVLAKKVQRTEQVNRSFDIDSKMERIQKGEDEQAKRPVRKKSELELEAELKAREEEEEELKEALRADAVRGIKEDEYKRRFSRSIDDLIASRDQSFTPEPVQRADHEAFQRMGRFGAKRKKQQAYQDGYDRGAALADDVFSAYGNQKAAPEPTEYQKLRGDQAIAKFLIDTLAPATDEEEAASEAAKPAEARLDQPDARDSSS